MNYMFPLLFSAALAAASFLATGRVRDYSIRTQLLAIPGKRSSHIYPTPSGGGAGFVVVMLAGGLVLCVSGAMGTGVFLALLVGGGAVAFTGWLDDRRNLSARVRFAVHCCAGLWALACLGAPWGTAGALFFFIAIAWSINSYNFMDGIDGLAAGEAAVVGLLGAALCGREAAALCLLAASAAPGFLYWNWPRARIFMGDAGSGFLGYVFGLAWLLDARSPVLPILLACFLADSTVTLLWRALRGDRWYEAHKLHAYQVFAHKHGHRAVTLAYLAVTVFWLAPLAWAAREWAEHGLALTLLAYAPLAGTVAYIHGRRGVTAPEPSVGR